VSLWSLASGSLALRLKTRRLSLCLVIGDLEAVEGLVELKDCRRSLLNQGRDTRRKFLRLELMLPSLEAVNQAIIGISESLTLEGTRLSCKLNCLGGKSLLVRGGHGNVSIETWVKLLRRLLGLKAIHD
jgi:hypothetical protein